jgi:adenylylsulfate kinase-like enzyme
MRKIFESKNFSGISSLYHGPKSSKVFFKRMEKAMAPENNEKIKRLQKMYFFPRK